MTDTSDDIERRLERLETIAETLEEGSVGLPEAKELREEADEHLEWLRSELEVESGTLVELSDEE